MDWLSIGPVVAVAVLLLVLPGAALALAFGLRGFAVPSLAPALSLSVIAVASTVAPIVHVKWSLAPVLWMTVVLGAMLVFLRRLLRRFDRKTTSPLERMRSRKQGWGTVVVFVLAVAIPALLLAKNLIIAFDTPGSFSQTFDNVFHLNALQYVRETGSASSLTIGHMVDSAYYPAGWHALVSLVGSVTSTAIPESVNAANLVIGALVWPLSMVYLVWRLVGARPVVLLSGGILSACFAAFPLLMLDYGVLYPNFLALAVLPACVGELFHALGFSRQARANVGVEWILLGAVSVGMTVAHPSALMALVATSAFPVLVLYLRQVRPLVRERLWLKAPVVVPSIALLGGVAGAAVAWKLVRPDPAAAFWPPTQTVAQAIGEAISGSPMRSQPVWIIVGLILMGLYRCVRQPGHRSPLWIFLVLAGFYVVVSGFDQGRVRNFLVGVWYNDSYRLAALLPLASIPVAVEGVLQIGEWFRRGLHALSKVLLSRVGSSDDRIRGLKRGVRMGGLGVVVLGLVATSQNGQVHTEELAARSLYEVRPNSPLITTDELALLKRLDKEVPQGTVLAGSPWTGTALAYALADRKTLQLHILAGASPDVDAIDTGLRNAPADGSACKAIKDLHVQYVLDFGTQEVHYEHHPYPGIEDLQGSHAVQLIDQQGNARLYKVVACQG
ncbi:DUF6541 family protein [Sinomonas terrae]|uniref:Glycosyltransferase RgtA/B/C/D-like domain-containing protein n=1 Tax=Sinomonas terrae TaxID=2908838 RepID=A0ABS9U018_9MICC|nr:DUF6541 family protein [Sinomonas terrae]MCH6469660.1 hypothetical protein [Sinomonas terrae]